MSRRALGSRLLVVLVVCALVAAPGVVLADADGQPRIGASLGENRVVAGEETTLQVTLTNAGELDQASTTNPALNQRVLTATGVSVALRDGDAPLSVTTARQRVGSLPDGGERVVPFTVSVDENARPGTYRLPVDVEYSFTSSVSEPNGFVTDETLRETLFVTVRVVERARFAVVGVDGDVGPASVGTVALTVENVGTETAADTSVALDSLDSAVTVGAGTASRFVGDWAPGERRTLTYVVTAADTAAGSEYPFRMTATFDDARGVARTDDAGVVGIAPSTDRRFVVTEAESDVAAGGTGTVTVTLRNDGPATEEATVALQSSSGALAVDGAQASSRFLGDWAAGAERTVSFGVTALPGTEGGTYALDAAVSYRGGAGVTASARPASVGVAVAGAPVLSLADVDASLAVGEQGTIRGTVVNDGSTPVRNAVVVLSSPSANVQLLESTYAVGDLAPGASAEFAADAVVSPTAEPGPRPVDVTVRYTDASGASRQSEPLQLAASVAEQPDRLAFEPVNATYGIDTDNRLEVRVTNVGEERLDDVQLRLAAGPPFSSDSPTAFLASLGPGETATVGFELTVSEDAVESTHAVALNATAETADGTTVRTAPELVPVTVAEPEGPGGDLALVGGGAALVVVVLVAGWWWLRR